MERWMELISICWLVVHEALAVFLILPSIPCAPADRHLSATMERSNKSWPPAKAIYRLHKDLLKATTQSGAFIMRNKSPRETQEATKAAAYFQGNAAGIVTLCQLCLQFIYDQIYGR
ncbi:hypothetical protein T10_6920 [Trichinella papuae]|uniref:Uncharacterized protein n=1 Tax=Trichinella papuae TaxID=268474 RepID=A0A0V1MTD8_9BILA|nr:hypothetical protein T10_6920 [Trichinella papuae]